MSKIKTCTKRTSIENDNLYVSLNTKCLFCIVQIFILEIFILETVCRGIAIAIPNKFYYPTPVKRIEKVPVLIPVKEEFHPPA